MLSMKEDWCAAAPDFNSGHQPVLVGWSWRPNWSLGPRRQGPDYKAVKKNCCHFSAALCTLLEIEGPFTQWVNALANHGEGLGLDGSWLRASGS